MIISSPDCFGFNSGLPTFFPSGWQTLLLTESVPDQTQSFWLCTPWMAQRNITLQTAA